MNDWKINIVFDPCHRNQVKWKLRWLKLVLTTRKIGPPILPNGEYGTGFNPDTPDTLPSWLTEDDLAHFVSKFDKTGFSGGLNYYRNIDL